MIVMLAAGEPGEGHPYVGGSCNGRLAHPLSRADAMDGRVCGSPDGYMRSCDARTIWCSLDRGDRLAAYGNYVVPLQSGSSRHDVPKINIGQLLVLLRQLAS
jgi:hypothetical protein